MGDEQSDCPDAPVDKPVSLPSALLETHRINVEHWQDAFPAAFIRKVFDVRRQLDEVLASELGKRFPGSPPGTHGSLRGRLIRGAFPKAGRAVSTSVSLMSVDNNDGLLRAICAMLRHQLRDQTGLLYGRQHLAPKLQALGLTAMTTHAEAAELLRLCGVQMTQIACAGAAPVIDCASVTIEDVKAKMQDLEHGPYEVLMCRKLLPTEQASGPGQLFHDVVWCGFAPAWEGYKELWLLRDPLQGTVVAMPRSDIEVVFLAEVTVTNRLQLSSKLQLPLVATPSIVLNREVRLASTQPLVGAPLWYYKPVQEVDVPAAAAAAGPAEEARLQLVVPLPKAQWTRGTIDDADEAAWPDHGDEKQEAWAIQSLVVYEAAGYGLRGFLVDGAQDGEWLAVLAGSDRRRACCTLRALVDADVVSAAEASELQLPIQQGRFGGA